MRIPMAPRICGSIFLLCAGLILLPAYKHWVATRTWVAFDAPISLAPGHIKTGDFRVNLSTLYQIEIVLNGYESGKHPECQDYDVIRVRWWLSRQGRVVTTWKDFSGNASDAPTSWLYLGAFQSSSGLYNLDVEIASHAPYLEAFHPHLRISTGDSDYARGGWIYATFLLASCLLIGVAVAFPLVSWRAAGQEQVAHGESLAIFDTLRTECESARRKILPAQPASILPFVGYVYALTCLIFLLLYLPFSPLINWPRSYGIPARVLRPGVIQAYAGPQITGLLVYVDRSGNLYLNSKRVTAKDLPRALQAEFSRRADWSVYVDGDSDADYESVVRAMDLVRSAQGRVIILTPNMRAEAQRRHH